MYYNDNVVWPRFLKFLQYYISYTYMNNERGFLHRYKYVTLFIKENYRYFFINFYITLHLLLYFILL